MLATSAERLPVGSEWTYEVKWDGYRALAVKDGRGVRLLSRNQKDLTRDYPTVAAAVGALTPRDVILDGEIVAVDAAGRPSFQALQHRALAGLTIVYYAFDILQLNAEPLVQFPLDQRRRRLSAVVKASPVLLSEPLPGTAAEIERELRRLGLEGVVAKRRDSPYRPGDRSHAWIKVKFSPRQEFVIGGYQPTGPTFESVLVGYFDTKKLFYAAKVRAGLTPHIRAELFERIIERPLATCPFVNLPNARPSSRWGEGVSEEDMATLKWVKPAIVIEVAFVEWTENSMLRHPQFVAIRLDKKAGAVTRDP